MFSVHSSGLILFLLGVLSCEAQRDASLPLTIDRFQPILRSMISVPKGRSANLDNIMIRHYSVNTSSATSYNIRDIKQLLNDPRFDLNKPTVVYFHGYLELVTDPSVQTIVEAYLHNGGFNILVVDWSNLAFGNYLVAILDVAVVGKQTGRALLTLLKAGLSLQTLHVVGHSLGSHVSSNAAKFLASRGYRLPRLIALDPAYPGFYSAALNAAGMSPGAARSVEVVHTNGGWHGVPGPLGTADFYINGGRAQPGCPANTIPFTVEDFCSHWRSWALWSESVRGGEFLARRCEDYESFLLGECGHNPLVAWGLHTTPGLNGNYYLRTAAKPPYALGGKGAE